MWNSRRLVLHMRVRGLSILVALARADSQSPLQTPSSNKLGDHFLVSPRQDARHDYG